MAKGRDGAGQNDPKKDGKPGVAGASPKKPSPIIDLKATEIKEASDANASKDKAKSDVLTSRTDQSQAVKGASAAADVGKGEAQKASGEPDAVKSKPAKSSALTAGNANGENKKTAAGAAAAQAKKTQSAEAGADSKADKTKSSIDEAEKSDRPKAVSQAPKQSSGSHIGSLFTHLVASIVGGAIVLFGVQPLENELKKLGLDVLPRTQIPAELEQRLAALEKRPVLNASDTIGDLRTQTNDLKKQVATLASLRQTVAAITEKVEQAAANEAEQTKAALDGRLAGIGERVAKIEATLANLADTTGPDGQPTNLARLVSLSGKLSDLEASLRSEIAELRRSMKTDIETQYSEIGQVSLTLRANTTRIDQELSQLRNIVARLEQSMGTQQAAQKDSAEAIVTCVRRRPTSRSILTILKATLSSVSKPLPELAMFRVPLRLCQSSSLPCKTSLRMLLPVKTIAKLVHSVLLWRWGLAILSERSTAVDLLLQNCERFAISLVTRWIYRPLKNFKLLAYRRSKSCDRNFQSSPTHSLLPHNSQRTTI